MCSLCYFLKALESSTRTDWVALGIVDALGNAQTLKTHEKPGGSSALKEELEEACARSAQSTRTTPQWDVVCLDTT